LVGERVGACAVVRTTSVDGRQACLRQVVDGDLVRTDVQLDDGPDTHGQTVRAIVGVVRVAESTQAPSERYRLIVQLQGSGAVDAGASAARVGTVVREALTVALANRRDVRAVPCARRDALLARIRAFIETHLGDPELTPAGVAAAHHISLRYLHRLFESQPHGVAGMIRELRLERCRRDLLDPAHADRTVAAIAARWGFASAAHFSRVFRAAHGLPPAEFRRAHRLRAV
jgi:AraC-like DNA-binding protein